MFVSVSLCSQRILPPQKIHHSSVTPLTAGLQHTPTALSHSSSCAPQPGYTGCGVTGMTGGRGGSFHRRQPRPRGSARTRGATGCRIPPILLTFPASDFPWRHDRPVERIVLTVTHCCLILHRFCCYWIWTSSRGQGQWVHVEEVMPNV